MHLCAVIMQQLRQQLVMIASHARFFASKVIAMHAVARIMLDGEGTAGIPNIQVASASNQIFVAVSTRTGYHAVTLFERLVDAYRVSLVQFSRYSDGC